MTNSHMWLVATVLDTAGVEGLKVRKDHKNKVLYPFKPFYRDSPVVQFDSVGVRGLLFDFEQKR